MRPLALLGLFAGPALAGEAALDGVRVQALSPTLLRIEPQGPMGFEDRSTFMVVNRSSSGIAVSASRGADGSLLFRTAHYSVAVRRGHSSAASCAAAAATDADTPSRSLRYLGGATAADRSACCSLCQADAGCSGYVFAPNHTSGVNCWPLSGWVATRPAGGRELGCVRGCGGQSEVTVSAADGAVLWQQSAAPARGTLHWPAPLAARAYALLDFPRFYVPEWGPEPAPSGQRLDPALVATNGYDFRNNVRGDTYVFLLGNDSAGWQAAREEFIALTGPTPAPPDYAWGTWFTWHYAYTEEEAKSEIALWDELRLPLDIWGLDMNWRYTDNNTDHFYDKPNTELFPDLANGSTAWFDYITSKKLRTYFNDHPYPVAPQTDPQEVAFRWEGLTRWMDKGLTFWWFDRNWKFSIPPPNDDAGGQTGGSWDGLTNAAWGSHLYHTAVAIYDRKHRNSTEVPLTLTKFAPPNWRPGLAPIEAAESPAQHRYPVWWTGDGVSLQASVHSMVDQGIHGFKPYVHSDCGGDYRGSAGDLMRWVAHSALGTVLRFHGTLGADHRPWTYDNHTVGVVRQYLQMRYRLAPSLIAAGRETARTAFPFVARCDLFWPEHAESRSNEQYIFLEDTLIAPIWDSSQNLTRRAVWIPPGVWEDAWTGEAVSGPLSTHAEQPYERLPMWHRRGGVVVTASSAGLRIEDQDWGQLIVEAWPEEGQSSRRAVHPRGGGASATVVLSCSGGRAELTISAAAGGAPRGWLLRLHLRPGQRPAPAAVIDGAPASYALLQPAAGSGAWPFAGAGALPPPAAGPVVELELPPSAGPRRVSVALS
eukprot:TRINITY_DN6172_c0_g1_i1.p1 TRINITY_DN6172_c0_g1~~TRINITY_DN6172_c0_g1_i1.p1  ORF type:complete len:851 (+),score=211.04 TRINITY_DN6172_c0_g1_i1:93-2555(+)